MNNNTLMLIGKATKTEKLIPNDSHKSFYGKARVEYHKLNGIESEVLISYTTPVLIRIGDQLYRTWDGWSATTGRHIRAFAGLNKKEFWDTPLFDYYPSIEAITLHKQP